MLGIIGCTTLSSVPPINTKPFFVQHEGRDRYERLAAQGNVEAMNKLGIIYTHGLGVFMNHQEALKWFRLVRRWGMQMQNITLKIPQMVAAAQQPATIQAQPQPQPQPAPRTKPRIATPKPHQRIDPNKIVNASSGSGFAVSTVGHVITNNHVIKGCKTVKIHTKGKLIPAKVIAYDSKNDIALLKGEFKPSTFFRFSIDNAQLLQVIYVAGYPFGRNVSSSVKVTKGIVSALIGVKDNTNQFQIDAALQPGNSGGPIIDTAGNVVGIAVSKLSIERTLEDFGTIPENTNFGVKSDIAKLLLLKNNINLSTPNINPITTAQLRHLISDSTYYLSCWMTVAQIQKMRSEKVLFNNLD